MAKISTYPGPSTPSLSDMLIGTDVNDMNATKNFTIGDVLSVSGSSAYVPYIGAINNVNLGTYNLLTDEVNPVSDIFITQDFFQSYGGIKLDYTLGVTKYYFGDFDVRSSGLALIIDEVTSTLKIGYNNYITIDDALNRIELSGSLYTNGSVGSAGQILTSQGAGLSPTWGSPNFVPYTGATGNVDLGIYRLTATSLRITSDDAEMVGITPISALNNYFSIGEWSWNGKVGLYIDFNTDRYIIGDISNVLNGTYLEVDDTNSRIKIVGGLYTNGSEGTVGQVLTSQGPGVSPAWISTPVLSYGSFYHTATITAVAPNVAYPIPLNSIDTSATSGVSIVTGPDGPTRITYANDGVYNIQFSAQFVRTSGGSTELVYIWIRKNGVTVGDNIPWTSTRVDMKANQGYLVAAWNFFVDITAGDWIELCWTTSNITIDIEATTSAGIYPSVPSVILTTNKVS